MAAQLALDQTFFVELLEKLIGETYHLQNRPPDFIPQEDKAGRHVLSALEPYRVENGGVLRIKHIHYAEHRGNIIIEYPAAKPAVAKDVSSVAFVGSHLDVVYANPETWDRDPFKLTVEGDKLYGRGTTDCLGHCALLTDLFKQLAEKKPQLSVSVFGVLIVDEESGGRLPIGVDELMKHGELDAMKNGPLIWLDCADAQPNIGSGGLCQWELKVKGKLCHSGFPNKGVNALEMASDLIIQVQKKFYERFPPHEREEEYGFPCSSSLKPTQIAVPESGINQIPGECTVKGDIRLIPFYSIKDAVKVVDDAVAQLREERFESLHQMAHRGPDARYVLKKREGDDEPAVFEWKWLCEPVQGIACHLDSLGFKSLAQATQEIIGEVKPLADTGTLPLVADLQAGGFDVQTVGYGDEEAYHADNEFALLSSFVKGFKVLARIIDLVDSRAAAQPQQ